MSAFKLIDFKNLCFQIEGLLNRKWVLRQLSDENYPKSFYFAIFELAGLTQKIILLCNKHQPIFGFVSEEKANSFDFFEIGFINNEEFRKAISDILTSKEIEFNILKPEILAIEFNGEKDLIYKLNQLDTTTSDITLTLSVMRPELFKYKLFHGRNIGY